MAQNTPWANNRAFFEWVEPDAWSWFEEEVLFGQRELRVLICAGSRNASRILRFFTKRDDWVKAKLPYPIKVVGVCSEKITDPRDAFEANAHKRFSRYLLEYSEEVDRLVDPELPEAEFDRIWTSHQDKRFKDYVNSIGKWTKKLGVPLTYLDPNTEEGFEQVRKFARRPDGRPPFNMLVSNPYRNWISYHLRKLTGEVSERISGGSLKRKLLSAQGYPLYGLSFGFHPTLLSGRQSGLEFMEGASPVDYYVKRKLKRGRLAMMGLGPRKMDDRDLWCFDGPISKFGVSWPRDRDITPKEAHEIGYKIVDWIWSSMEETLRGDYHSGIVGIGAAIAERINALYCYHARSNGG